MRSGGTPGAAAPTGGDTGALTGEDTGLPAALSVLDLLDLPGLGLRLLAGATGTARPVRWAHTCETAEPWRWLEPGDLALTVGLGLPADATAQCRHVEQLTAAGVSGLVVAESALRPALSPELLHHADRLGFPVLEAARGVHYSALVRVVAENRLLGSDTGDARDVQRLDAVAAHPEGAGGDDPAASARALADLTAALGCRGEVLDPRTRHPLLRDPERPVDDRLLTRWGGLPARATGPVSVRAGTAQGLAVRLPARSPAVLLLQHPGPRPPRPAVLRHLADLLAVEVDAVVAGHHRRHDQLSGPAGAVLDGGAAARGAAGELAGALGGAVTRVLALDPLPADPRGADLHVRLRTAGHRVAVVARDGRVLVLLAAGPGDVEALAGHLPGRAGVSAPVPDATALPGAARQAVWALDRARATGRDLARHEEEPLAVFLPRSDADADAVVGTVLGPVLAHDAARGADLRHSLEVFLACNRSWQRAAGQLFVHKQTLVYRMRKVEELTGLALDRTEDVVQLWLALATRRGRAAGP